MCLHFDNDSQHRVQCTLIFSGHCFAFVILNFICIDVASCGSVQDVQTVFDL